MKRNQLLSMVLVCVFLVSSNLFSTIIRMPYVQSVTHTSATIMIESTDTNNITVNYHKSGENATKTAKTSYFVATENTPKSYVHRIVLDNLKNSERYSYKIDNKSKIDSKITGITDEYTFVTANKPSESFKFVVMGDSRSGPKIFDKITDKMASHKPNFALYLGDLAYKQDYKYWEDEFFIANNEKFIANVPFYNAVGNHEGWNINTEAFTDAPKSASNHKAYYSFEWGDIHFLMLSTEHSISTNSAQYKFALEDLKNSKSKWNIVAFHIPAYGAGAHGENKNMIEFSKNVIDKNNVTMVLTGHSHFYQHNKVNDISHFVLGGGGSPLYPPASKDYTLKSEKKYHYALFDVNSNQIKMTVIDKDGNKLDEILFK
jgi:predicted phosphodiesterase